MFLKSLKGGDYHLIIIKVIKFYEPAYFVFAQESHSPR